MTSATPTPSFDSQGSLLLLSESIERPDGSESDVGHICTLYKIGQGVQFTISPVAKCRAPVLADFSKRLLVTPKLILHPRAPIALWFAPKANEFPVMIWAYEEGLSNPGVSYKDIANYIVGQGSSLSCYGISSLSCYDIPEDDTVDDAHFSEDGEFFSIKRTSAIVPVPVPLYAEVSSQETFSDDRHSRPSSTGLVTLLVRPQNIRSRQRSCHACQKTQSRPFLPKAQ